MERVVFSPGHKLLYAGIFIYIERYKTALLDTDSMIYLAPRGQEPPFTEGSYLGQMKDEYPHHDIISFYRDIIYVHFLSIVISNYSGGAKQYGLEMRDRKTGEISRILKCRGITLDSTNEDKFNFDRFKVVVSLRN